MLALTNIKKCWNFLQASLEPPSARGIYRVKAQTGQCPGMHLTVAAPAAQKMHPPFAKFLDIKVGNFRVEEFSTRRLAELLLLCCRGGKAKDT